MKSKNFERAYTEDLLNLEIQDCSGLDSYKDHLGIN